MSTDSILSPQAWDEHTRKFRVDSGGLWRDYCDRLHLRLISSWLSDLGSSVLKTDLFDEAIGDGLLNRLDASCTIYGLDIAHGVVESARRRNLRLNGVVTDLRALPFSDGCFDTVISNSSLDHFDNEKDLIGTLAELQRTVRVGGHLLITLDNPMSPIIGLRRLLPYTLLHRIGILPYPVGATLSLRRLRRELSRIGFSIERKGAIMHVPRVLAIPLCKRIDARMGSSSQRIVESMLRAEALGRLPTKQVTGHFVAVLARKL